MHLLEQGNTIALRPGGPPPLPPGPSLPRTDERPARRSLLDQIERLEYELAALFTAAWPRQGFEWNVAPVGGPRLLTLGELEGLRDDLAERVEETRHTFSERTYVEEQFRCRIEEMLLEPEKHKWVLVSNENIGEPGCKHWHVRPRWGILGMFLNWWRVRISSGCPLATGTRPAPG